MQVRPLALVVSSLAFVLATAALSTVHAAASQTEQSQPEVRAHVAVTVTTGGSELHLAARQLEWDGATTLHGSADDHEHAVEFSMRRSDDGQRVHLALRYLIDGATVVTSKDTSATLAEPVRIASKDGKTELVFVVNAEAPRKKIEVDGSDDPLGGL